MTYIHYGNRTIGIQCYNMTLDRLFEQPRHYSISAANFYILHSGKHRTFNNTRRNAYKTSFAAEV